MAVLQVGTGYRGCPASWCSVQRQSCKLVQCTEAVLQVGAVYRAVLQDGAVIRQQSKIRAQCIKVAMQITMQITKLP
jgi:hypothetical protein